MSEPHARIMEREPRVVIETDEGITVYPARWEQDRWRAAWYEDGTRMWCEAVSEERLAAKLAKVAERLACGASRAGRRGAELIEYYLSPERHPPEKQWSRKHADSQRYLCTRYLAPVIGDLACQDITSAHVQAAVNAAPTPGEGRRVKAMISALVGAGIAGGYLTNERMKNVHWQAGGRSVPAPRAILAGESPLYVDPAEIPSAEDVRSLGRSAGRVRPDYELMVNFAAYTGVRWGELAALTADQIVLADRTVVVDRKIVEVRGRLLR